MKLYFNNLQSVSGGYSIDVLSDENVLVNAISLQIDYSSDIVVTSIIPSDTLPDKEFFIANSSFLGKKSLRVGWFSNTSFVGGKICTVNFTNPVEFTFNVPICDIANSSAESYANVEYDSFK